MKICTILGSCVSVCLFDPANRIAGMNHYLLPCNKMHSDQYYRFGNESLEYMLSGLLNMGADKNALKAGIFGGSSMFEGNGNGFRIGQQNIEIAKEFVLKQGIFLCTEQTGGSLGRKIVFDTNTGLIDSYLLSGRKAGNKRETGVQTSLLTPSF